MEKLPVYSVDLIKQLDQLYPNKHPTLNMPDRQIWFEAGKRSVVDFLLSRINTESDSQELPQLLNKD